MKDECLFWIHLLHDNVLQDLFRQINYHSARWTEGGLMK